MIIEEIIKKQRLFFEAGNTRSVNFRIDALRSLRAAILKREPQIYAALKTDLNKSAFETYMTEIGMVLDELRFMEKHITKWAKNKRVKTPLAQFYAKSFVMAEPYGVVLIMAPWNYPFQLSMEPLVGALCAGNCVVLKPSAYAPLTMQVMAEVVADCFSPEYVTVVQGGRQENSNLLAQRFDYIFFTGGVEVGKLVMESAARHLTPLSLELGGKSPCIVDETADLKLAAKRIIFGKLLNAGQTCVAPDYLFVQTSVKEELVRYLQDSITAFLGESPLENEDYPKIINPKHFARLCALLEGEQVLTGGEIRGEEWIAPTLLDKINSESKIMKEEIFGPILPILTFETMDEPIRYVNAHEKPLALYLFTTDKGTERRVLSQCSFGGGCVNDTIIHLASSHMGFGGVGQSGMGSYHGKKSFDTFSHYKSIVKKSNWMDIPIRYHPYTKIKMKWIKHFLK